MFLCFGFVWKYTKRQVWGCNIYFVVFVQRKKKKIRKKKRRNKIPQEKKKKKCEKEKKNTTKIELFYLLILFSRLEENKSCFGFSIGMSFKVVDLSCKHVKHLSFLVLSYPLPFTIYHPPFGPCFTLKPL